MSAAAPWSVKGIDPKAREVAKDLARRSGMTLGEWLNSMIMEGDEDERESFWSSGCSVSRGERERDIDGTDMRGASPAELAALEFNVDYD